MRIVLDTNVLVSGIISSGGPPRYLFDGAKIQAFELCSSATLLAELHDVLAREKFAIRLAKAGLTPQGIVRELRRMAYMVAPSSVPRVIEFTPPLLDALLHPMQQLKHGAPGALLADFPLLHRR